MTILSYDANELQFWIAIFFRKTRVQCLVLYDNGSIEVSGLDTNGYSDSHLLIPMMIFSEMS